MHGYQIPWAYYGFLYPTGVILLQTNPRSSLPIYVYSMSPQSIYYFYRAITLLSWYHETMPPFRCPTPWTALFLQALTFASHPCMEVLSLRPHVWAPHHPPPPLSIPMEQLLPRLRLLMPVQPMPSMPVPLIRSRFAPKTHKASMPPMN